jgi:hypothetical protein
MRAMLGSTPPWVGPKNDSTLICLIDMKHLMKEDTGKLLDRAAKIRQQCAAVVEQVDLPSTVKHSIVTTAALRLVHFVFNKRDQNRGRFKAMADIGTAAIQELSTVAGKSMRNPFDVTGGSASGGSAAVAATDERVLTLKKKGIAVGTIVCYNRRTWLLITAISSDAVNMVNQDNKAELRLPIATFMKDFLSNKYVKTVKKTDPTPRTRT